MYVGTLAIENAEVKGLIKIKQKIGKKASLISKISMARPKRPSNWQY